MTNTLRVTIILVALGSVTTAGQVRVAITVPVDGAAVVERPIVEGTVSDPKASVWLIVHPLDVSDYWVQPSLTVRNNGSWKVQIYVGRPGRVDVGKPFEIRAVANSKVTLREGMTLDGWPESGSMSNILQLTRK